MVIRMTLGSGFFGDCAAPGNAVSAVKTKRSGRQERSIGRFHYLISNQADRLPKPRKPCDKLAFMRRIAGLLWIFLLLNPALGQTTRNKPVPPPKPGVRAASQKSKPDVFLVTIDTLRADHV